ncbi:hypothetical protein EJB05_47582 [Eragrostis curvula]|uniref:RNase H type-1 domain-containing protein n=1 Tax=Eragrostis curvula TaxID=38414 RepID=A0A5J9SZM7_9POAL|nr:hypothetical protein EJB05_47582 [Eragrostis curvula]
MLVRSFSSSLCGFLSSRAPWRRQTFLPLRRALVPQPPTRFFSSSSRRRSSKGSTAAAEPPMDAGEPFYVVRKGNVIGIYKTLSECQAQVSKSVCDPSVTVFKGYSLRKDTEEYLAARGLRNALYSIDAADARDELFGDLVPCPFQQPDATSSSTLKRSQEIETGPSKKHAKLAEQEPLPDSHLSCILEFDGASKGNPGKAGAGAIIRRLDGSVIAQLREGLGIATNNAAEYRALLLGLKYAAKKGFKYVRAQGDSKLVCNQVQDLWRTRNDNMSDLYKKVKELKGTFLSFQISHVLREFNSAADAQANFAVELPGMVLLPKPQSCIATVPVFPWTEREGLENRVVGAKFTVDHAAGLRSGSRDISEK